MGRRSALSPPVSQLPTDPDQRPIWGRSSTSRLDWLSTFTFNALIKSARPEYCWSKESNWKYWNMPSMEDASFDWKHYTRLCTNSRKTFLLSDFEQASQFSLKTLRRASAATRLGPNSGRSSQTSMGSTPMAPTSAPPSFRWSGSRWQFHSLNNPNYHLSRGPKRSTLKYIQKMPHWYPLWWIIGVLQWGDGPFSWVKGTGREAGVRWLIWCSILTSTQNCSGGKFVPRAILVDLEPGTMDSVRWLLWYFSHGLCLIWLSVGLVVNLTLKRLKRFVKNERS